ncbi:MAG: hypothetical protein JW734_07765 [Candidatus Omnitrophica bacterium]|nr:hypothetical protein [Candidatus Omnitrophota bacterium]
MYKKNKFAIFTCCFLILLAFAFSVHIRRQWFARPLDAHFEWQAGHSVCVTNNWLKEGAFSLRFMHVLNPDSIEFDSFASRKPYVSYPPGTFIPVFLIARIFNITDLVVLYQCYNLFNHLVISIILFLLMFMIIDYFRKVDIFSTFFSLVPSLIYLFTAHTLYYHQNVFFTDQAVMLWFVIFVYMEIKRVLGGQLDKRNRLILLATVFMGTLTDWLFVFVLAAAICMRMIFKDRHMEFKHIVASVMDLVAPALAAVFIFSYQIISTNSFFVLIQTFKRRYRVGEDGSVVDFFQQHFVSYVIDKYGLFLCLSAVVAFSVLAGYYMFIVIKRGRSNGSGLMHTYLYLCCLVFLPCLLQVNTFQQHSIVHDFSALKWALPLSLVPFGIFPVVLIQTARKHKHYGFIAGFSVLFTIFSLAAVFGKTAHEYRDFFDIGSDDNRRLGELVRRNAGYYDICFSFDFDIPVFPPPRLAYSGKRVYRIGDISEARNLLAKFEEKGAKGKIFIHRDTWGKLSQDVEKFCSNIYIDCDYYICEIARVGEDS